MQSQLQGRVLDGYRNKIYTTQIEIYESLLSLLQILRLEGQATSMDISQVEMERQIALGSFRQTPIEVESLLNLYDYLSEAKFVEPYNNGMAVLAGISSTYIYEYNLNGSLQSSYNIGTIDPIDGKNTLHEDGTTIYACLSGGGLVACSGGSVVKSLSSDLIGSVNCVDTDDKYIYIANGTKGLTIIDKTDWTLVKEYKLGDASANYIKLGDDGYIYVAYGLKGVHRFKLVD